METYEVDRTALETPVVDSTDASQSAIGQSTAIDYNLASIHKNAVIIVNPLVSLLGSQLEIETFEVRGTSRS